MKTTTFFLMFLVSLLAAEAFQTALAQLPTITSFSPSAASPGMPITITGNNFKPSIFDKNIVYFGAVKAEISYGSSTSLTVRVPVGAAYASISVTDTVNGLTAYSTSPFRLTFATRNFEQFSLASKVDFSVGANPRGLAIGDIDGDGKSDLVTSNAVSNNISTLRNTSSLGTVSFATKVDLLAGGTWPGSVALSDIDGDAKLDIVGVGRDGNTMFVLRNTSTSGTISFNGYLNFASATSPEGIAIGDLDLDGRPDIAVTTSGNNVVSVFRNTSSVGSISFGAKVDYSVGNYPKGIGIADIDGDGKLDLVVANYFDKTVSILRNIGSSGNISFSSGQNLSANTQPNSIALCDFDGDGRVDFAIGHDFPSVSVYRNLSSPGAISLSTRVDLPFGATGNSAHKLVVADVDGDAKPDIVSSDWNSNNISVFRNLTTSGTINSSSFSAKVDFTSASTPYSLAAGDIDGDGKTDLAVVNDGSASVSVLRNVAAPLFTEVTNLIGVQRNSLAWGDYDNDGDLDILLTGITDINTGSRTSLIYGNLSGFFSPVATSLPSIANGSVDWGDYDNDGDLDILITGFDNTTYMARIYKNDNGTFTEINTSLEGIINGAGIWGDYDNDGDLDILLTGHSITHGQISKIYRNDDSAIFTDVHASLIGGGVNVPPMWGDYDNDGDLDILLSGLDASSNYATKIYRNDNGSFVDINASLKGIDVGTIAWGDYDSDGDFDVLISGDANAISPEKIYRNENGSFVDIGVPLSPISQGSSAWGDYDNDGDLDIIQTGGRGGSAGPVSIVYRNDNGNFTDIGASLAGVMNSSVAWGDYDDDGDLDILLSGWAGSPNTFITKVYRNYSPTMNTFPNAPTNLSSTITGNSVLLLWNKSTDSQTAQNALTYNIRMGTNLNGMQKVSPMANLGDGRRRIVKVGNTNHNNSWTIKNLANGTYYWSVQTVDNTFAGSLFAAEQTFTIGISPPALISPINDATGVPTNPTLKWWASVGATSYRLQISTNETFSTTIIDQNGIIDTSYAVSGLANNTLCYWRVNSSNATDSSLYSVVWQFRTRNLAGDVSGDGTISSFDASLVLQHVAGIITLQGNAAQSADASGDGSITGYDAALILQFVSGIITSFPGG